MRGVTVVCAVLLAAVGVRGGAPCVDLDPSACHLMASQRPDLCSDPVIAPSACPKFCNLCPIQCFHCDDTVNSLEDCTAQKQCGDGEVCMKKTMISYVDGHKAFQLSCESKQHCDGSDLHLSLGKRDHPQQHVQSRNVLITCCGSDLCNGAPPTTTEPPTTHAPTTTHAPVTHAPVTHAPVTHAPVTHAPHVTHATHATHAPLTHAPHTTPSSACKRDVIVMIDDAHPALHDSSGDVKHFIYDVVNKLKIGTNDVLVSLTTYTTSARQHWDLNDHTTKSSLQHAITGLSIMHMSDHADSLQTAINYLLQHKHSSDNRPDADDIVIILAAHDTEAHHHGETPTNVPAQFHRDYPDVVAINYHHVTSQVLHAVATSSSHVFDMSHTSDLGHVVSQVASLICPVHKSNPFNPYNTLNNLMNGLFG